MRIITTKEMQGLDAWAIKKIGIPQIVLMENAGRQVAEKLADFTKRRRVCIVAYKGNNGGDGFVAARHLKNLGFDVSVFLLCRREEISGSARINLDILNKIKIPVFIQNLKHLEKLLLTADLVVDAIFGIGLSGEIKGLPAKAIEMINNNRDKSGSLVIAVDVPSGVNATSGKVAKQTVQADLTVTFAYPKKGLLKYPGVKFTGRLVVADIGIPCPRKPRPFHSETEYFIPKRAVWTHKGDYGRVLIVAGSKNMSGAAYLAARAAIRSGAGLVYLAVPESIQKVVAQKCRENIVFGLPETAEGTLSLKAYPAIKRIKADLAAIGPGLTAQAETKELVKKLVKGLKVSTLVIDADGLNSIADQPAILKRTGKRVIITPHPGEMGRLAGKSVRLIQHQREAIAMNFARKYGIEVVLKGAYTITARKGKVIINSSGNPGMASAGVGDVLTGMIAGLGVQGFAPEVAVYLHGLAGDLAAKDQGEYGLIASDIVKYIPYALRKAG